MIRSTILKCIFFEYTFLRVIAGISCYSMVFLFLAVNMYCLVCVFCILQPKSKQQSDQAGARTAHDETDTCQLSAVTTHLRRCSTKLWQSSLTLQSAK